MASLVLSTLVFAVFMVWMGLSQRKANKRQAAETRAKIQHLAQAAQKQHVRRFGRESTQITQTLGGGKGKANT